MLSPVEQALRHVRQRSAGGPIPSSLPVTLNFHPDTVLSGVTIIERLAREGIYRSQFETGISNGGLTAYPGGNRWIWERDIFGGAYDRADPSLRPKYGALNHRADPVGGSRRFGSCHLRLRPHALARTTFCYPDSQMRPRHFAVSDRMALIKLANARKLALDILDDYIEAHVHGPLRVAEDVEAIVLDPCYEGTPIHRSALSLPCTVEWHTGFRLPFDRLGDCERYRGAAAADAIASICVGRIMTPLEIGAARVAGMAYQLAKWAWHCAARFGDCS